VKLLLLSDLSRRWTLAEIGAEIGGSHVHLTQLLTQVEGVPLYRYHLRLRLARALDLIAHHEDLAGLALELGSPATAILPLCSGRLMRIRLQSFSAPSVR
jgi:AraC family transcriptional regulator